MKKFLSIVLALAMMMALSTTVFAAPVTTVPTTDNQAIGATYTAPTNGSVTNTYYYTISWGSVTAANYNGGTVAYKWDAESMEYVVDNEHSTVGSWTDGTVSVTVESKSDMPLTLTPSVAWADTYTGTSTMKKGGEAVNTVTLESAARTAEGTAFTAADGDQAASYDSSKSAAQSATIDFTITPTGTISEAVATIATVTITVAAVA